MARTTKNSVHSVVDYVDSWLAFRQYHLRVPGVQAAVLVDDELALSTAHGHADVESGTALTSRHLFRIASHSKIFTATAVLQLVETGRVRLDDPLQVHLPWIADRSTKLAKVTVREVLCHGAGIVRDGAQSDFWQLARPFPDVDELRDLVCDASAVLEPNERFKYSNIGYSLLGMVIAAASRVSYTSYVTTEIVKRLGLDDTSPELDPDRIADYATGYTSTAYRPDRIPIDHVSSGAMVAATGFSSTAQDVCRYAAAHFLGDTRLLSDASKRLMRHVEWEGDDNEGSYGLGFAVRRIGDRLLVGHSGGYPGHITQTLFDPKDRFAVSVLTNAIDGPAQELATGVVKIIDFAGPAGTPGAEVSRFCGRYANLWHILDIVCLGGRLVGLRPTQADPVLQPIELAVEAPDRLRITEASGYSAPGETITFDFDGDRVRSISGPAGMTFHPYGDFQHMIAPQSRITARP